MEVTVNHQFDQALKDAEARGKAVGEAKGEAKVRAEEQERRLRRDAFLVKRMVAKFQVSYEEAKSILDAVDRDLQNTPENLRGV